MSQAYYYFSLFLIFFIHSNSFTIYKENYSNIFIEKGTEFYAKKDYKNAIVFLKKAIKDNPVRGEAYFYIGIVYDAQKKYYNSIPYFKEAIRYPIKNQYWKNSLWKIIYYYDKIQNYKKTLKYIFILEKKVTSHNLKKLKLKAMKRYYYYSSNKKIKYNHEKATEMFFIYTEAYDKLQKKIQNKKQKDKEQIDLIKQFDYLRSAIKISKLFENYAIPAGELLEKFKEYKLAKEFYSLVKIKKLKPKAYYKIGILEKKTGNFKKAISYLKKVLIHENISDNIKTKSYIHITQSLIGLGKYNSSYKYIKKKINWNANYNFKKNITTSRTYCISYLQNIISNKKHITKFQSILKKNNLTTQESISNNLFSDSYFFCNQLSKNLYNKKKIEFLDYYLLLNWEKLNYLILPQKNIYKKFHTNFLKFYFANYQNKIDVLKIIPATYFFKRTSWITNNFHTILKFVYDSKDYSSACIFGYKFYHHVKWNSLLLSNIINACDKEKKYGLASNLKNLYK